MTCDIGSLQEQQSSRENPMSFSRRTLLKASAASAVLGGIGAPLVARAQTAEFTYKYANNLPDGHPMNARAKEMAAAIKAETNGRFDLQIFPNNQLGSDTDMLSQIRSGGVDVVVHSAGLVAYGRLEESSFSRSQASSWRRWCRRRPSAASALRSRITTRSGRPWTGAWAPISVARSPRRTSW